MSQDPLQNFPLKRWGELQNAFKTDWSRSISGNTVLETQRTIIKQGFDYGFTVYCPYGDVWNGMVAINEKEQFYEIIILCPRDDTTKLEDALRRTRVIDWERSIIIPYAPKHVIECVQRISNDFTLELLPSEAFVLDRPILSEDVSLPQGIRFDQVSEDHMDLVDSTWPHRYPTSRSYFQFFFNTKMGYGLFQDNELIAWVFFNESGNLLHLYTVESHRKRGYAELLLKFVSNILLKDDKPVIAYCLKTNVKACKLYSKLGFYKSEPVAWCYLNKKVK